MKFFRNCRPGNYTGVPITILALFTLVIFPAGAECAEKVIQQEEPRYVQIAKVVLPLPGEEDTGGRNNISLSAGFINNTVLTPGEVFSFNGKVGPRNTARGFKESEVIIWKNGKYIKSTDIGGGICRTATGLHQAVAEAGLDILERHSHSLEVDYAEQGNDAAIWYGVQDYRFINNKSHSIKIESYTDHSTLKVVVKEKMPRKRPVKVIFNGMGLGFPDQGPFVDTRKGRTFVPLRITAEAMGARVQWDSETRTITVSKDSRSFTAQANGEEFMIQTTEENPPVPATLVNNRIMVPLRFMSEALGAKVMWLGSTATVRIQEVSTG